MAIIGFFMCLIVGMVLLFVAGAITIGCQILSGKIEWIPVIIYSLIGSGLIYFSVTHSPFTLTTN